MGFLSADNTQSSSSTSNDNRTSNENKQTTTADYRVSGDDSITQGNLGLSQVEDSTILIEQTDLGAVMGGLELGARSLDLGGEVVEANSDFGKFALESNREVTENALFAALKASDNALEVGENLFGSALDHISNLGGDTQKNAAAVTSKALTLASESTRSEEATTTKNAIKYGAAIAIVLGVTALYFKMRKG